MQELKPDLLLLLREQIGCRGLYNNQEYELIEVLEHDAALVLRDCSTAHTIQSDMHGEAHRMVSKTHTVPLFSEIDENLHPVLKDFFSATLVEQLQAVIK